MITTPSTDERALHVEAHRVLLAPASGRRKKSGIFATFVRGRGFFLVRPGLQNQLNNQQKALLPQ
jgi:hypothetical protein